MLAFLSCLNIKISYDTVMSQINFSFKWYDKYKFVQNLIQLVTISNFVY